jgi:hypothetical protein
MVLEVRGIKAANRVRIFAQCSSLNSTSGSATSSFRKMWARSFTPRIATSAIRRNSPGA